MNVKYELQLLNLGFGNINTWHHFLPHVMAEAELVSHPDMFNENKTGNVTCEKILKSAATS